MSQTYTAIEIIIVDDGSTDNPLPVIEELKKVSYFPILYNRKENGGCASARNAGVALAKGDIIAFLDSDDEWYPNAIHNLVDTLVKSKADYVYSPVTEVNKDGTKWLNLPVASGNPNNVAVEHFLKTNIRNGSVALWKRVFDQLNGFDTGLRYNEDSDFIQRMAINYKAAYCPEHTAIIYQHAGNKSSNELLLLEALLKSSERSLQNESFSSVIGPAGKRRIDSVRIEYIENLLSNGSFNEVSKQLSKIYYGVPLGHRLSLLIRSRKLWKMFEKSKNFADRCFHKCKVIFQSES